MNAGRYRGPRERLLDSLEDNAANWDEAAELEVEIGAEVLREQALLHTLGTTPTQRNLRALEVVVERLAADEQRLESVCAAGIDTAHAALEAAAHPHATAAV